MTFANFSWPWVAGGLAFLAAGLYALQILRIRYRDVTVVSTLLWRRALQDAPVRKLRGRFRHPWAYLLILTICALIWLALAEPQPGRGTDGSFHIMVLDGSAVMDAGDRFDNAVTALKIQVATLPKDRRQVLWSGAEVLTLLNPGEHERLLERRLEALSPQAAPSRLERLLGELAATRRAQRNTEVVIFGAAPVRREVLDSLPETLRVQRATESRALANNAGITALGAAEAQSGAWGRVDVLVRVQSSNGSAVDAARLRIDLDGDAIEARPLPASGAAGSADRLLRDLPALGGLLTVKLSGEDDLALDDTASIRLPTRPPIDVQLSASLDPSLRAVLQADPAVRLTDVDPRLVIRREGEDLGAKLPALEFVSAGTQSQAFLLTYPQGFDTNNEESFKESFAEAVEAIGLRQIDAMALADAAERPIEVSMRPGNQWKLSLWRELLTEDFNFTRSRTFPLFVASSVRWLAGIPAAWPYAAAGQPLLADAIGRWAPVVDEQGRAIDPLGVAYIPEQAGALPLAAGARPLSVSLLDPVSTTGGVDSTPVVARAGTAGGASASHVLTVLLLLVLILLALEWYGYREGRIP